MPTISVAHLSLAARLQILSLHLSTAALQTRNRTSHTALAPSGRLFITTVQAFELPALEPRFLFQLFQSATSIKATTYAVLANL